MIEHGIEMDNVTYSNAIRGMEDSLTDTRALFDEMEHKHMTPDFILVDAMLDSFAKRGKIESGMKLFSEYCKYSYNSTSNGRSLSCHKRSAGYAFFQIMHFYKEHPYMAKVSVCTGKSSGDRFMKMREEVTNFVDLNCPRWFITPGSNEGVIYVNFREIEEKVKTNARKRNRRTRKKPKIQEEKNLALKG